MIEYKENAKRVDDGGLGFIEWLVIAVFGIVLVFIALTLKTTMPKIFDYVENSLFVSELSVEIQEKANCSAQWIDYKTYQNVNNPKYLYFDNLGNPLAKLENTVLLALRNCGLTDLEIFNMSEKQLIKLQTLTWNLVGIRFRKELTK